MLLYHDATVLQDLDSLHSGHRTRSGTSRTMSVLARASRKQAALADDMAALPQDELVALARLFSFQ